MQRENANAESQRQPAQPAADPMHAGAQHPPMPPLVSVRWILAGLGGTIVAAALCAWCTLCILFWQGSWQLLYHPTAAVTRTPASIGLPFEAIGFASNDAGQPRLSGWWIPAGQDTANAPLSRYTVLYLHEQDGNLSNTLDELAMLHGVGVNVLAFDYRGYGRSEFARPSEPHWRDDAEWALAYLTGTRHVSAGSIVLYGDALGANLALEVAARHPELGGVVLRQPLTDPSEIIFSDPRAYMVPAHLLARDRFDLNAAAEKLRIPSLWLQQALAPGQLGPKPSVDAFLAVTAPKKQVWLRQAPNTETDCRNAVLIWLSGLAGQGAAAH